MKVVSSASYVAPGTVFDGWRVISCRRRGEGSFELILAPHRDDRPWTLRDWLVLIVLVGLVLVLLATEWHA